MINKKDIHSMKMQEKCRLQKFNDEIPTLDMPLDIPNSIPHAEKKEYYPMLLTQKRTYLLWQMYPDSLNYNMPELLRIKGKININAIKEAFQTMVQRHEILRTKFYVTTDGDFLQKVNDNSDVEFEYVEDTSTDSQSLIYQFIRPFDLSKGNLIRMKIVKRTDCYLLLLDKHHIVCDTISNNIFMREFTALCNGSPLEPVTHQYKDYSEWMNQRNLSSQKEFWMNVFKDEVIPLDLYFDYPRPKKQSFKEKTIEIDLESKLSYKLKEFSNRNNVTEYVIFLSVTIILLSKYGRQEDIVVGSSISGRVHKDTQNMLGMFVNTVALRCKPKDNMRYIDFLNDVKELCLKAYENQEYPFEELVEAIGYNRGTSMNRLFDVMFSMQNAEEKNISLEETEITYDKIEKSITKYDLMFNVSKKKNGYEVGLKYCTELFKKESAEGMLKHYVGVLEQIIENHEVKISDIEIITKDEKNKIMCVFNATDTCIPKNITVIDIFEEQVKKTPDKVAVKYEDKKVTYADLNMKANIVARKLRKLGVKQDDFVAMFTEISIEMIVGIYAILKAGGAYVPMDASYPEKRIQYMLQDCKPKAILSYNTMINTDIPVINLGDINVYDGINVNLEKINKPKDLVYCIYTSGTTSKPKGVLIQHAGLLNLCHNLINVIYDQYSVEEVALIAAYVFDASLQNLITPLMFGRCLHIISDQVKMDADKLTEYILNHGIEAMDGTPIHLDMMDTTLLSKSKLKVAIIGGDELKVDTVKKYKEKTTIDIYNVYGPTESTVDVTSYKCKSKEEYRIPIGKVIANNKIYIVANDKLCGIGVPGELCIVGVGLAREYLNHPELTARSFINNPFGKGKMYRTGDLARWLPNGNIEFLGRMDGQVKVRGFRIELGEIESAIKTIKYIKDSVVLVKEDSNGEKAIYAYLVSDQRINISYIRDMMSNTLPYYIIPTYMIQIEKIPITCNGKLDRKALPDIKVKIEEGLIEPATDEERILTDVFMEVLKIEELGTNDNIFSYGVNSLKLMQVVAKLKKSGYIIDYSTLVKYPSIASMAKHVMKS